MTPPTPAPDPSPAPSPAARPTPPARPPDPKASEFPMRASDQVFGEHPPERRRHIDLLRRLTLGCTAALVGLGLLWELWLAPLPGGTGALAVKVVPLACALPGLWRHRLYTYRWLSLLIWLYVTEGIMRAVSDKGLSAGLGLAEALLSTAVFVAIVVYVRLRLSVLPPKPPKAPKPSKAGHRPPAP